MAQVLSLPFRLSTAGAFVTVEQGDDEYFRQQLVTILLTEQGERVLNNEFGMPDMTFDGFLFSTFESQVSEVLPEISDLDVEVDNPNDVTENVSITFRVIQEEA